ncbi:hypothetical protein, conserved [Eimeria tenella]|uniref:Protein LTV1 homolog n=1 Tax=Eimeria tenella TaxID=5802 RepID=U6L3B7_EIMTE|nr:hypothetical protein, conserved [Eimeria tenella]CDJ43099.1 hypothetical protein, conserved [Eimeria tenella]|eukprot:XP_013233849.1 hypothetical protein, conserved [Eimeria tenella]
MSKKGTYTTEGPPAEAPESNASGAVTAKDSGDPTTATVQKQQQQQQGKGRKVRFQKNNPNNFTFKLLPLSQQQLRQGPAAADEAKSVRMQLQRVIPPNARSKPQQPLPEYLQKQIDQQEFGTETVAPQRRLIEPDLSGDCYFPQDGYDYSQHLVTLGGGTLLPHPEGEKTIAEEEKAAEANMRRDKEASQVLAALEACDAYEEIADDFVAAAATDSDGRQWVPDEKELLWGSRPPLLPPTISDRLFGEPEERDSENLGTQELTYDYPEEEIDTPDRDKRAYEASADDTQAQRLEQLLEEYRDECIGELDPDEVDESDSFSAYEECFDSFLKSQERTPALDVSKRGEHPQRRRGSSSSSSSRSSADSSSNIKREDDDFRLCDIDDELRDKTLALARLQEEEEERAPTVHVEPLLPARARPSWDGETIISARSGVSVQPRSIIVGSSRTTKLSLTPYLALGGGPLGVKGPQGPRRAQLPPTLEETGTAVELPEVSTYRPRGETTEERKARKTAVKEAQRLLRANKKANKQLLKVPALVAAVMH